MTVSRVRSAGITLAAPNELMQRTRYSGLRPLPRAADGRRWAPQMSVGSGAVAAIGAPRRYQCSGVSSGGPHERTGVRGTDRQRCTGSVVLTRLYQCSSARPDTCLVKARPSAQSHASTALLGTPSAVLASFAPPPIQVVLTILERVGREAGCVAGDANVRGRG